MGNCIFFFLKFRGERENCRMQINCFFFIYHIWDWIIELIRCLISCRIWHLMAHHSKCTSAMQLPGIIWPHLKSFHLSSVFQVLLNALFYIFEVNVQKPCSTIKSRDLDICSEHYWAQSIAVLLCLRISSCCLVQFKTWSHGIHLNRLHCIGYRICITTAKNKKVYV